jgi:soluble P-type ATPase
MRDMSNQSKPGIRIEIPGFGDRHIHTIVSDYTGTLSFDGRLIQGVRERLTQLASVVDIHVLSADTFGTAALQLGGIPLAFRKLEGADHDKQKAHYVRTLDTKNIAVFGNGNNDRLQLKAAKESDGLAIAVDNGEGCAVDAILNSHIFIVGIANALDLLIHEKRCKATLRF